ncbi:MAG TPA: GNAT family N-acetyltransferase [Chroococcales cyanobacterium]
MQLTTARLLLRPWKPSDQEPFAELNADSRVMEFFPRRLTAKETSDFIARIQLGFEECGFGLWAAELAKTGEFIGFIGLWSPRFEAHFTPCVEIGWRLAHQYWGQGYAPEGAKEALRAGFEDFGLKEIVSMTATLNERSMRVMEKIGMTRNQADDFLHPVLEDGDRLKPHVLYRLSKEDWQKRTA